MEYARKYMELVALGVAVEWEAEKAKLMEETLRNEEAALGKKKLEFSMLMQEKDRTLAELENGKKLFAQFLAFIEAVESNDPDIALKFDEKAMKDSAFTFINSIDTNYGGNGVVMEGTEINGVKDNHAGEN